MTADSLLTPEQKDKIKAAINSSSSKIIYATLARIYYAYPQPTKWSYNGLQGGLAIVRDTSTHFMTFKLVDLDSKRGVIWEHELYEDFEYAQDRSTFHSFPGDKCMIAFVFADGNEAQTFAKKVTSPNDNVKGAKKSKSEKKKKKKGGKGGRIDKSMISAPTAFVHVAHMGYDDERGFTSRGIDPSWVDVMKGLQSAGVTEDIIEKEKDFIRQFMQANQQMETKKSKPPPPPARRGHAPGGSTSSVKPPSPPPSLVRPTSPQKPKAAPPPTTTTAPAPPARPPPRVAPSVSPPPRSAPPAPPIPPTPSSRPPVAPPLRPKVSSLAASPSVPSPPFRTAPPPPPAPPAPPRSPIPPAPPRPSMAPPAPPRPSAHPTPPTQAPTPPPPPPPPPALSSSDPPAPPPPPPPPPPQVGENGNVPNAIASMPPPQPGRNDLLASIQGKGLHSLRKIEPNTPTVQKTPPTSEPAGSGAVSAPPAGDLTSALAAALLERNKKLGDSDSDGDDEDDDWD